MGIDATMLGSGSSTTSTSTANCVRFVRCNSSTIISRPDRFLACSGLPAWRRLINGPLATTERVSLVTAIFSDRNEIETVKRLCGDDAQTVIDVMDEVLIHFLISRE